MIIERTKNLVMVCRDIDDAEYVVVGVTGEVCYVYNETRHPKETVRKPHNDYTIGELYTHLQAMEKESNSAGLYT